MKHLIPLLAFSFLIGCDGEKSNETNPPEAVSVNPNLKYEIKGDTVAITRCAEGGASGDFVMPTKIKGKTVTSIEKFAFRYCTNLTSITISDGVTSIGGSAFYRCTNLTSITIPDSVTSIIGRAFYWCTSLSAVTFLGDAPEIANDAFKESSPTIYREADAKGWGDTLAGRPVKLITEKP